MSGSQAKVEDQDDNDDIEIEIVDDTPEPDKGRPKAPDHTDTDDDIKVHDDEISTYRADAQKRIKELSFKAHSERRAKEAAVRERTESDRLTQNVLAENKRLRELAGSNEQHMVNQAKQRAEGQINALKAKAKAALEAGDSEIFVNTQEELQRAVNEHETYLRYRPTPAPPPEPERQPTKPVPEPTPRQRAFMDRNPWFDAQGDLEHDMTGFAFAVHHKLVEQQKMDPMSEQYYSEIETAVRKRFPEYWKDNQGTAKDATSRGSVVAPASRGSGKAPRSVRLSSTQEALCKRFGLTPQQYAKEYLKAYDNG